MPYIDIVLPVNLTNNTNRNICVNKLENFVTWLEIPVLEKNFEWYDYESSSILLKVSLEIKKGV